MKHRIILTALSLLVGFSALQAQDGLVPDRKTADIGSVLWKKAIDTSFKLTNKSSKPIIITKVESSCGCVMANWQKTPIQPGEQAEITATYDAALMGHFVKFVDVYTTASTDPVTLTIQGNVVRKIDHKPDAAKSFPFKIGEILLTTRTIDFGDCSEKNKKKIRFEILNNSKNSYEPVLMHLPPYITMEASPSRINSGRSSRIELTFDAKKYASLGLAKSKVYLSRFPGDKVGADNEINISAIVVPDFSRLTDGEKLLAPVMGISSDSVYISLSSKKSILKKSHTATVEITNGGKSPLDIKKIGITNVNISVSLSASTIQPGQTAELTITAPRGKKAESEIILITNDPQHPKQRVKVVIGN